MTAVECDACGDGFDPSEDDTSSVQRNRSGEVVLASCGSCVRQAGLKADSHADPVNRGGERA